MPKLVRHIMPLGMRVLVRVLKQEDTTDAGLYLPEGAKEKMTEALYGEVVEVARAASEEHEEQGFGVNVAGVPHGARILFKKDAGVKVPWDEALRILETKEVLAMVEEISPDEIS